MRLQICSRSPFDDGAKYKSASEQRFRANDNERGALTHSNLFVSRDGEKTAVGNTAFVRGARYESRMYRVCHCVSGDHHGKCED